jgi:hypothetical protein
MKTFYILLLLLVTSVYAKNDDKSSDKKEESTQAIEVKGQSRNFNMKLVLRTKKDKISFVKTRKNYRDEILSTEP